LQFRRENLVCKNARGGAKRRVWVGFLETTARVGGKRIVIFWGGKQT